MSDSTVVRIEDLGQAQPRIEVTGSPNGYNIYVGPLVSNAKVEHGALINLLGVDLTSSIPDQGWRLVDPALPPDATRNGLYILWLGHDHDGPLSNGDLQVGFNSVFSGRHYANPIHTRDTNLGPAKSDWMTVYSSESLVLLFKPCLSQPSSTDLPAPPTETHAGVS
jgi:hypothetical protein